MRRHLLCAAATAVASTSSVVRVFAGAATSAPTSAATTAAAAASNGIDERALFEWWDLLTRGEHGAALQLLDPRWWVRYILAEFEAEPAHCIVETICILTILYLLVWRKPAPIQQEKMSKKEEDQLIAEWTPEPLCPKWSPPKKTRFIVESAAGRTVIANGSTYVNFASTNFLGLADEPDIKAACRATIDKYGVGSCGPRGFYGTFDLHLEVEAAIAKFMRAEACILYSDALACVSSVIPAFAKKGDTIVADDAVSFGMQQGCLLSRSTIHYFKHGDMDDLERVLASLERKSSSAAKNKNVPLHRKFIVAEGVSSIDGDVLPLARVVELKDKYAYRLILDDSLGFGVLGAHGRGTLEHSGMAMQVEDDPSAKPGVDILCATVDGALASVGGFCVGSHKVADHQRLSGAGYCYSASSPPYTSTASILTLERIVEQPELSATLRKKAAKARKALSSAHRSLTVLGTVAESPVIHVALKTFSSDASTEQRRAEFDQFEAINTILREQFGLVASVPEFIPADRNRARPSLRILISVVHTDADIDKLVKAVATAAAKVL